MYTVTGTKLDEKIDDILSGKAFWEDNKKLGFHCVVLKVKDN